MAVSITHPEVFRFPSPYSTALRTGNLVFVAGTVPADAEGNLVGEGDAAAQTWQVFTNIQRLLEAAGARLEHLAQVTYYLADMNDWQATAEARRHFLSEPYPATSTLEVSRLVNSDWLIEIDAIAVLPDS